MKATVLIVDDNPGVVKLIGGTLRESGYEVLEAAGGPAALRMLRSESIDVLVIDVKISGISGPEIVRRAWEFAPELPVVFIMGRPVADDIPCAMLSRARIVTKPSAKALRDTIAQALGRTRSCGAPPISLPTYGLGRRMMKPGLRTGLSALLGL